VSHSIFGRWYRDGSPTPLQAIVNRGGSKDHQTTSTLTITPTKEDDGARYRCVVFNRAMKDGEKYETTVTLSVNCKYLLVAFISYCHNNYEPPNGSAQSEA
jgi:CD80-like C2-set immunoglobulin domain